MREMKDSGIPWIGEIPVNWKVLPIKHNIIQRNGGAWGEEPTNDDGTICLRIADFDYPRMKFKDTALSELTYRKFNASQIYNLQLKKGDLLIEKSGGGEKTPVGRAVLFDKDYPALFANFMDRLVVDKNKVIPQYMCYLLNAMYSNKVTTLYIKQTIGIQNLNLTALLSQEKVCIPDLQEQNKLANFLDSKCAEIDSLMDDIQSQIEKLEQYKKSLITETVTKGLGPNAEMKDSGNEWIGEIPSTWRMLRGKYIFRQRNERGNRTELQLLSPTQKYGVIPQWMYEEKSGMNAVKLNEKVDLALLKTIHKGDFCISLRSFQGGFEYSLYEGVVSPAYQVFYPFIDIVDGYYKYLFKERSFIDKMNSYTMSLRDGKNIAFSDFGNTEIPVPPLREQMQIADFLDKKISEIDSIIKTKQEQLETISQYKKSLIFEYVTGKKEVP